MYTTEAIDHELMQELEQQEATYWGEYYRNVPPEIMNELGVDFLRVAEVSAGVAANIDILAFNRVIGFGMQSVTENQSDEIIDFYKDTGARCFFVQLSPAAKPDNLPELLQSKGLEYYNNWVKWFREIEPLSVPDSKLPIEQIGEENVDTFAEILTTAFDWPEAL
ncbi:MAG: hypothetical protein GWN00_32955, partial [Aliifodinibius sp.]|nr:hypothetical protein [Fodinibius sp.]NIV15572.1 hypothetical protein [Fodinibius sp.]NIY29426.1 hypothetical protein [Fodinibius sp.]